LTGAVSTGPRRPARRIVFLGPPGAGKGTQAVGFARVRSIPHLSTGDLLRAAVAARTPLGAEADGYMRAGKLVPDQLVLRILSERLALPDAQRGFVLDGFPRTLAQAEELDRLTAIDAAVWFEVEPATLVARLSGRRICPKCQRVYNVATRPPREADRCDDDHSPLLQRPDDRPEAVEERLRVFARDTAPLLEHYRRRGLLATVDATGAPETVERRLASLLPPS
jgi:adenylate kinase